MRKQKEYFMKLLNGHEVRGNEAINKLEYDGK